VKPSAEVSHLKFVAQIRMVICDLCRNAAGTLVVEVVAHGDLTKLGTTCYILEERSSMEPVEVVAVR
jgi:hypothetical protein